jgi:peptidyl-prolyl cis-trans isomerase SurA
MQKMSLKSLAAAAALVVMTGLSLRAEVIEQILVKVNGEIFTKSDLEQRQISALRARNRGVTENDLKNDNELKKALAEITPNIVVQAVDELLMMQRAKEMNLKMTDERFNEVIGRIRKENKLDEEGAFEAALKQEGMTLDELRHQIERDMLINQVTQQDVMQKIAITEEETKKYYEEHKADFTTPANVTLREILVNVPDRGPTGTANAGQAGVNVGLDEDAKGKAEAIRARVLKGEDFAKIATAESDAPSKANGGLIGPINKTELSPGLQKVLDGLKVGGVSEPIRITKGWQLIKLETAAPTVTLPFEQAREQVTNKVFLSKRGAEMDKYVHRMREQAIIEWKNDEIKKLYDQALAADAKDHPVPADATAPTGGIADAAKTDAAKTDAAAKPDATTPAATKRTAPKKAEVPVPKGSPTQKP